MRVSNVLSHPHPHRHPLRIGRPTRLSAFCLFIGSLPSPGKRNPVFISKYFSNKSNPLNFKKQLLKQCSRWKTKLRGEGPGKIKRVIEADFKSGFGDIVFAGQGEFPGFVQASAVQEGDNGLIGQSFQLSEELRPAEADRAAKFFNTRISFIQKLFIVTGPD
jgi:hypothetical protein